MPGAKDSPATLDLYLSRPHPCSYLSGQRAQTLFADPDFPMDMALYSELANQGFRRSGEYVYRPQCPACQACIPARIPVKEFRPDRSQRRTWRRNEDLSVWTLRAAFRTDHFKLYQRYMGYRHPGSEMDGVTPTQYKDFFTSTWADTWLYEFRLQERLLAVAVVDRLLQGLSAIYTFFDPELERRSLGVYAILWQVAEARRQGLPWVYLGYWIEACPKMSYKSRYQPLEIYQQGRWQTVDLRDRG